MSTAQEIRMLAAEGERRVREIWTPAGKMILHRVYVAAWWRIRCWEIMHCGPLLLTYEG